MSDDANSEVEGIRARLVHLERRLERERTARKEAERLLDMKSRELFEANRALLSAVSVLEYESGHDALTGMANRRTLMGWIGDRKDHRPRTGTGIGIVSIDLDHFKEVNDSLGHAAGDRLLQALGERIRAVVRDEDLVVRMGGDEVIILLGGIQDEDSAVAVAKKTLAIIHTPLNIDDVTIFPTASVGVTMQDPGEDPEEALLRADRAMYAAKEAGGDRVVCRPTAA